MTTRLIGSMLAAGAAFGAWAETETVNGIEWTYHVEDGMAIVGYSAEETNEFGDSYAVDYQAVPVDTVGAVVIPSSLGGYPVRSIGDGAFEDCSLVTSIEIPSGVTEIGDYAFGWCEKLGKITIPASVAEIGDSAFAWCTRLSTITLAPGSKSFVYSGSMLLSKDKKTIHAVSRSATALSIPAGVEILPYGMLAGCSKLTSVILPKSVVETVDGWADAFGNDTCTSLKTIKVDAGNPMLKVVNNLLIDKDDPESIAYVPAGLASVTIPASTSSIDLYTAAKCTKLAVDAGNPYYKVSGNCILSKDGKTLVAAPPALKSVAIPAGVEIVASWAFADGHAESVVVPASVRQLGDYGDNYTIEARVFGDETTSITFLGNPPITLWNEPLKGYGGEIRVSSYAVDDWRDFFAANAPHLSDSVVGGLPNEPTFRYAVRYGYNWGDAEDGEYELDYGEGIVITGGDNINGAVTIPAHIDGFAVTGIGRGAFKKNKNIAAVAIPDTVDKIGYNAFGSCTGLRTVTIAGGEEVDMGKFAFSGCLGLAMGGFVVVNGVLYHYAGKGGVVTIPDGVRIVDDEVFRNNTAVTAVNIPSSVREVRDEAFEGCTKLTRATFAEGCEKIGDFVFYGCPLARFNVPATAGEWVPLWETVVWCSRKLQSLTVSPMESWESSGSSASVPPGAKVNVNCMATFNPTGGEMEGPSLVEVPYLDALWSAMPEGLPTPTRKGYNFQGWYTAKSKGSKIGINTIVARDTVYYAQWKPNKYKVAVNATAGGKVAKSGSYSCGSTVKFTAAPSKGYVFVRWDTQDDTEELWPSYAGQCRLASLSLKIPPGDLALTAVFAKSSADVAPVLSVEPETDWYVEDDPDREISVEADSLSFPSVAVKGQPAGIGLVKVPGTDDRYLLKVTDASKLKPGVYTAKITAKNRAGRSVSKSVRIVAPNSTAALGSGLIAGLETSTLLPYVFDGGMKVRKTLADLGVEVFATNGWKLASVTGLPAGLSWNGTAIVGAASKTGLFTVTFTMKKTVGSGKKAKTYTSSATATFRVDNLLPEALAGTYSGFASTSLEAMESGGGDDVYMPMVDGMAKAAKVTVTTAGKVTANICGTAFSANGFDSEKDGVYTILLKKTQKVTSGALKGGTKVWQAQIEIDTNSAWDGRQLSGWYSEYTVDKYGSAPMKPLVCIAAQRNPFALAEAKSVAAAVVASGRKGAKGFIVSKAYDEDFAYTLECAECMVGGAKAAVTATAKASGTVALAGTIAKTKVSASAVLEVSPEVEDTYEDYDEYDNPIEVPVRVRTATARFLTSKFVIEVIYTLEDGEVVDTFGKVWRR